MGCFNDPAWKVCGWWVVGWVADTNYLYTARWGWIKNSKNENQHQTVNSEWNIYLFCQAPQHEHLEKKNTFVFL